MVNGLSQQLGEKLVVEDLEAAATGNLANSGWVEAMLVVAISALHKDAAVAHTLSIDLSPDIVQMHTYKARAKPSDTALSLAVRPFPTCWFLSLQET